MLLLLETIKLWVATVQKLFSAKILPFYIHIQINSTDQKSHYNRNSVTYCSRVNYFFDISPFILGRFYVYFLLILLLRFFFSLPHSYILECFTNSSHIRVFLFCSSKGKLYSLEIYYNIDMELPNKCQIKRYKIINYRIIDAIIFYKTGWLNFYKYYW